MKNKITKPGKSAPGKLSSTPKQLTSIPSRRTGTAVNEHGIATFGHEDIAALAHTLWQARGCPEGSPEEDWFHAAHELRARGEKSPEVMAHPRGSESMKRSYLSSFPMRAVLCAALLLAPGADYCWPNSLRNFPLPARRWRPINSTIWWRPSHSTRIRW